MHATRLKQARPRRKGKRGARAKPTGSSIRILIADDHPVVREGLLALINGRPDMEVVAEAASWPEAMQKFFHYRPDVALLDLRMPGMDGASAVHAIRSRAPDARIILITIHEGDEDAYGCLRAGAKGYVLKDSPREDLFTCIRTVYEGRTWIPSVIASKLADRMTMPTLSARELEVLRLMADGKSNKEIANQLNLSEGTIKTHMNHILTKLEAGGRTEATIRALRRGLIRLD